MRPKNSNDFSNIKYYTKIVTREVNGQILGWIYTAQTQTIMNFEVQILISNECHATYLFDFFDLLV
jgi:hypothetical protein